MPTILNRKFQYTYWNVNAILVGINIFVYFLTEFVSPRLVYYLAMLPLRVYSDPKSIYTFITCGFTHANLTHLFSNMLGLIIFGSMTERSIGSKEYLLYYFICLILSSALSYLFYIFSGEYLVFLLGASGVLYAIMLMFATFYPNARVFVFGIFPMSARTLVIVYFLIEFFSSFISDGISHVTHLFGLLVGFIYIVVRMRIIPFKGRI